MTVKSAASPSPSPSPRDAIDVVPTTSSSFSPELWIAIIAAVVIVGLILALELLRWWQRHYSVSARRGSASMRRAQLRRLQNFDAKVAERYKVTDEVKLEPLPATKCAFAASFRPQPLPAEAARSISKGRGDASMRRIGRMGHDAGAWVLH